MSSPQPPTAGGKTFECPENGCTKAFLRSEHLARHRLNHRPSKIYACSRCPKKFVRPDLYQRHIARHEKGMWYRQVGGVVEENISKDHCPDRMSYHAGGESSSAAAQHSSPPNEDLPEMIAAQTLRDIGNRGIGYQSFVREENVANALPQAGVDTFFFDDSANVQDLPEDLNWFFEDLQPHLMPTMGTDTHTMQNEPFQGIAILPELIPMTPQPPLLMATADDNPWAIALPRIFESLRTLPAELLDSVFFHPYNLSLFYDLYFKNYHHHFPILHRPTLSIEEAPPLLLTAILTLGSTLAESDVFYQIGQQVHDALRWIIFNTGAFEPPSPLWCLQALLLVQAQGKMFSTTKQHEMAHIFHGSILTMMKRGRSYSTISNFGHTQSTSLEISWHQWAEDESSRRTAFFAFIMDAQHASVFGHTPVLSVSDMRLPLPCADALWECTTAGQWAKISPHSLKPPQFLPTLKSLLGRKLVPSACSDFSRFLLLHGLLSLTNHLHARDNTTLGIGVRRLNTPEGSNASSTPQVEDWKDTMSVAIETWSFCLLSLEPSLCLEAAQPLHRMAYITLHTNITDFHIIAKDTSSLDNMLLQNEFSKAQSRVRAWSRRDEAKQAITHSLMLVKETVFTGKRYRAREDNIALRPWCLYHAILVLWAYGLMVESPIDDGLQMGAEEYVVRMLSALQRGKGGIPAANKTRALVSAMADALEGCRWALLGDAYLTLRRLSGR